MTGPYIPDLPVRALRAIGKSVGEYLMIKLDEIRKNYPEIEYIQRNIQPDHVHLVVSFPPKYSIAQVV